MTIFGFLLLIIPCSSFQLKAQTFPNYNWLRKTDLPTVTGSSLNTEDITIAIAQDSNGNIYTLSVGSGVDKRDSEGNLLQKALIPGGALDSPRDLVIDEEGLIYVADYLAAGDDFRDNGKIRVFDPAGNYLPGKTFFTSFYRPLGLDISGDKVYVAEYYDGLQGPEQGSTFSRVRIYDKNTGSLLRESRQVDIPLRVAVNSSGQLYVSQAGASNPAVLIFNANLDVTGELPNITSPGSVIVDELDYIHVIEYGNRIKFSEFINFDNLSLFEISNLAQDISTGVKNEEFFLKIFSPDGSYGNYLKNQLDFPVDVSQKGCGDLFVNNSEIFDGYFWGMYLPSKLEFDLEVYERSPSLDAAEEPVISCPADIEVQAAAGAIAALVNFADPAASDICGATVTQTGGLPSGSNFPVGENTVEFTAEDAAGNKVTCSFTILVQGEKFDEEPPEIQCTGNFSVSANSEDCTALAQYDLPIATDNSGEVTVSLVEGPGIGEPIGIGVTAVKYQATDAAGNIATCQFEIRVIDDTPPVIENCPGDQQEVVSAQGFMVPDYTKNLGIKDCSENVTITQVPAAGTLISESAVVNLSAEDEFGNSSTECSFELLLTPKEAVRITSCANARVLNMTSECEAVLPDFRSEIQTNIAAEIIQEPAPGTVISEDTTIRFTATDANGNTDSCEITITVKDNEVPEISCPGNKEYSFDPTEGFVVPDFRSEAQALDNCALELVQDPAPGTRIYSGRMVFITAIDASGNESFCDFELRLTEEVVEVVEIISCATSKPFEVDAQCQVVLPDFRSEIQTNIAAEIIQEPAPGTVISEDTIVRFTATDANKNTDSCETTVTVEDTRVPEISCPGNKEFSFYPENGFVVPDFRSEAQASDNCAFELVQDPAPGTRIYSGRMVFITVIDASGNESFCEFELRLTEEVVEVVEIISCATSKTLEVDVQCQAVLPDFRNEIQTNIAAEVTQEPAPGTVISEDTTVRFTATDANGNTDSCEITITVKDNEVPEISCPGNKEYSFDPTEGFVVPDFRNEAEVSDNCAFELIQEPAPGTRIYSGRMVFITAIDASGNESFCDFELRLTEEVVEVVEIISCATSKTLEVNAQCQSVLPDFRSEIQTNITAVIIQEPAPGTALSEDITVRFTVTDANENTDTCETTVTVEDTAVPEISCHGNKEYSFDPAEGFVMPDFRNEAEASDNCAFELVQDPAPGTRIYFGRMVFITAIDSSGNESFCDFELRLKEEVMEVVEIISCATSKTLEVDAQCQAVLPDFRSEIQTNIAAEITQEPVPGTAISEDTTVRFTATDANENTDTCETTVTLEDRQVPEISCPGNKEYSFDPAEGFVVPDFRNEAEVSDNCAFELVQDPAPGTRIYSGRMVFITAIDASGNESFCDFELRLTEEVVEVVEIISCATSKTLEVNAQCQSVLPEFRNEIQTNITAEIIQEPAPGTMVSEDTTVRFTATDANGNTDSCEIVITVKDDEVPEISCPGDIVAAWDPEEGYLLPDFTGNISVQDNCGGTTIVQEPLPGSLLMEEQEISFIITDASGNSTKCGFWLYLSEEVELIISCPQEQQRELEENCGYVLEDLTSLAGVNFENAVVSQEPPPGTVLFGDTNITITAQIEGQSASCSFDLRLEDAQPPQARCVEIYNLQLNAEGSAIISAEDIDNGSFDNCEIVSKSLSKTTFSEADVGEQPVILTVVDSEGNESSCETTVVVTTFEDSQITCVEAISLQLNADRRAVLDPRDLFTGGTGTIQFNVDKEQFTCADIGEQKIIFSYTTPTEEGSCEIAVLVEDPGGYCRLIIDEPEDPGPYVIISPNPGSGLVEIFTSADIAVHRAEVYDMRGRFLLARDFAEGSHSGDPYALDLRKYQSGVYTINLETNSGQFIRRAIIKND